jgi:hypothetical protein
MPITLKVVEPKFDLLYSMYPIAAPMIVAEIYILLKKYSMNIHRFY